GGSESCLVAPAEPCRTCGGARSKAHGEIEAPLRSNNRALNEIGELTLGLLRGSRGGRDEHDTAIAHLPSQHVTDVLGDLDGVSLERVASDGIVNGLEARSMAHGKPDENLIRST